MKLASIARAEKSKRSELTELRQTGKVPAVIYGYNTENTSVAVDENEFIKVIREVGRNGVIDLDVNGKVVKVMVNDYQFDSLKNQILHLDFIAINMNEEVTVDVVVHTTGEAVGVVDEDGVLEQPTFEVQVTATPDNIPEEIVLDVSELSIGDTLYVSDINIEGDFTIENEDDEALVTIVPPQKEEELETDEDAEGEETEGEGSEDAEGEEASEDSEEKEEE